jgi:chloramphenicol 3-O-phosphotransferase
MRLISNSIQLAHAGNNLVIDYIIETHEHLDTLIQCIGHLDVLFVGVYCPLPNSGVAIAASARLAAILRPCTHLVLTTLMWIHHNYQK